MIGNRTKPILLYNDECGVCRHIAHWVLKSAPDRSGETRIVVQPIGDDPEALRSLNPDLDIWDAYETVHVLMPDGSMKLGGEAVAEVLRNLPNCKWFAWCFALSIFGFRPFQKLLNLAYDILADVRPIFGCESCGTPSPWVKPIRSTIKWMQSLFSGNRHPGPAPHFTSRSAKQRQPLPVSGANSPQARLAETGK